MHVHVAVHHRAGQAAGVLSATPTPLLSLTPCLRLQGGPLGGGPGHLLHTPYSLYGLVLQRIRITQEKRSNYAGGGEGQAEAQPLLGGGGAAVPEVDGLMPL